MCWNKGHSKKCESDKFSIQNREVPSDCFDRKKTLAYLRAKETKIYFVIWIETEESIERDC